MGREAFESAVERAIEYIRAGDIFQANLAHRLSGRFEGSTRALFAAMCAEMAPWHGVYIESFAPASRSDIRHPTCDVQALLSCSPELFLRVTPSVEGARVVTRPMKGTRPAGADARELEASAKDRAELNMIIDLMRNDLGRVCRVGSVRVEEERAIERHGGDSGVLQAVATVSGVLREGAGLSELLAASFPPGSVTGAPKIRAMQIIDELEPVRRGPYCGAAGWIGADGSASLNVAIRTALVSGRVVSAGGPGPGTARLTEGGPGGIDRIEEGVLDYSVGAGIVADSDPGAEWRETLDKAAAIQRLCSAARVGVNSSLSAPRPSLAPGASR